MKRTVFCLLLWTVLVGLYAWFRYAALEMETSRLPEEWAVPIASDGQTLMTYQQGDPNGRPIVFVHGTPGAADNWSYFLRTPKAGYQMIAVDRPGFGASTPSEGLPSVRDQAAALRPLLEGLQGRNPILVGHSLGGPIIAQAAVDYPHLVGGLVVVAGSLSPSVEKIYAIQYLGDLPILRLLLPCALRNSNRELIPLRKDLESLAPRLGEISCPVVIVHGTEDMLVPFENVAYMEQRFAPGTIVDTIVLEGENHFLPWTAHPMIWNTITELGKTLTSDL